MSATRAGLTTQPDTLTPALLLGAGGLFALAAAACVTGDWQHVAWAGLVMAALAIALSLAGLLRTSATAAWAVPASRPAWARRVWLAVALLHILTALCMLRAVPGDDIDTCTFQREACRRLVHGIDPYGGTQPNLYSAADSAKYYGPDVVRDGRVQVGLQYPPLTVLWALPGYALGDVRLSYVLAVLLAAWLLLRLSEDTRTLWASLALLANPLTLYVENRGFTEPLVLLALVAAVYAAVLRPRWLAAALGIFLATKQYNVLALPLTALLLPRLGLRACMRLAGLAVGVVGLTLLPFALWNARALAHDLIWFHLAQPFRQDAVSFAVLWPGMLRAGPVLWLAMLVWAALRLDRVAALFAAAYGSILLLFVATGKQAFANYYFLAGNALLLAAAILPAQRHTAVTPAERQDQTA